MKDKKTNLKELEEATVYQKESQNVDDLFIEEKQEHKEHISFLKDKRTNLKELEEATVYQKESQNVNDLFIEEKQVIRKLRR